MLKFIVACYYGKQSFEGFVGVSSPRLEPQLATPQPTENIEYEIPLGYALEKWELTLKFVFMPMDTM